MSVKQNTLKGEFSLKGKGLHTGKEVCATFKPAAENTGYKIVRVDLEEKTEIPALAKYIELVDRASCLQKDGAKVYTLEHAMAALYGCGIDNCVIELSGEEFPILDGSARYYVEEIQKVGIEEQQAERRYFSVKKKMEFYCEASDTRITLLPDDTYSINTIAERPGHKANTSMAKMIYKEILAEEKDDAYPIDLDLDATPLMDINKIRTLLPHRPPFLLVDKIYKVTENMVIGCKNVTMNEPHFVGHFPDEPVMPGVLIVEAMSQCGGILVLSGVPDPENYSTYFMKIDGVKFRNKVVPGDTLVFKLITTAPIKRGIVQMKGYAYVGKKLVCEGEFMAQVAKTKNL